MSAPPSDARLELERDLYRECLELPKAKDPAPLLDRTLSLLRELMGAHRGYIEIAEAGGAGSRRWSSDTGVDDEQRAVIRERLSRGIVAAAIETDEVVHTHSAFLDERFAARASVRNNQIEEVLCVPLRASGIVGVVYLENHSGAPPFGQQGIACARTVAGFSALVAGRLLELLQHRERADLAAELRAQLGASHVIGRSPTLAAFLERLAVVAPMESNTLLTGPSGAGKSMFAALIHRNSRRASGPFVELNCAALPENLVESELFGAVRGAHSGVVHKGTPGKVAAAEGGTLFLDEIGELDRNVQAKLLLLLESKQYYPLGSTTPLSANIRIIAATNIDLDAAKDDGAFREDLYFRLSGVALKVPSLAERREDIPLLAEQICDAICRDEHLPPMRLSPSAMAALEFGDWPGNVRELINTCKSGVINARLERKTEIEAHHLFPSASPIRDASTTETFQQARASFERSFLSNALERRDWNVALTARELDMSRSHLNALIRKYTLTR